MKYCNSVFSKYLGPIVVFAIVLLIIACNSCASSWYKAGWKAAGFSLDTATAWHNTGFNPDAAKAWHSADFSPDEAKQWKDAGFTPEAAKTWRKPWRDAGYSVSEIIQHAKREIARQESAAREATREYMERFAHEMCPNGIKDEYKFMLANPYAVKSKCFNLSGQLLQLFSRETALYRLKTYIFYVDFSPESAPRYFKNVLLKGDNAFKYTAADGSIRTVSALSPLIPDSNSD